MIARVIRLGCSIACRITGPTGWIGDKSDVRRTNIDRSPDRCYQTWQHAPFSGTRSLFCIFFPLMSSKLFPESGPSHRARGLLSSAECLQPKSKTRRIARKHGLIWVIVLISRQGYLGFSSVYLDLLLPQNSFAHQRYHIVTLGTISLPLNQSLKHLTHLTISPWITNPQESPSWSRQSNMMDKSWAKETLPYETRSWKQPGVSARPWKHQRRFS